MAISKGLFTGQIVITATELTEQDVNLIAGIKDAGSGRGIQAEIMGQIDAVGVGQACGTLAAAYLSKLEFLAAGSPVLEALPLEELRRMTTQIIVEEFVRSIAQGVVIELPKAKERN